MKPILFNTEMVQAILEGRKTVTRRVIKDYVPNDAQWGYTAFTPTGCISCRGDNGKEYGEKFYKFPYQAGDILYVREMWNYGYFESSDAELDNTHWFEEVGKREKKYLNEISYYIYRADFTKREEIEYGVEDNNGKIKMRWKPSIHMPKEAARIFLRVTNVSVAKLQNITEEQAIAEGAMENHCLDAVNDFKCIWDNTLRKENDYVQYGWFANPWVWVIEFERIAKQDAI